MTDLIAVEKAGHILKIGLNRPEKKNALNREMFQGLREAYTRLCAEEDLRCGILYSQADLFTAGLDLADVGPLLMAGEAPGQDADLDETVDPFNWGAVGGARGLLRTKPLISAIHGKCFTAGIELSLAADVVIASDDAEFAQAEVRRGLMPLGGAVERFTRRFGWGNGMRWLLTGDAFDVHEAHRIGFVQEIVPRADLMNRAMELAGRIASAAPLGVRATLENAYIGQFHGPVAAADNIQSQMTERIAGSADLQEGITAMFERREPAFTGT